MKAKQVFVFGSNEAGVHGAGAAKYALQNQGAKWGIGFGHVGDSFAIPTKDHEIKSLSLKEIEYYVGLFLAYASITPQHTFKVTRIGCGLAGFTDEQIAPLFVTATINCQFDEAWKPYFKERNFNYWGTQ